MEEKRDGDVKNKRIFKDFQASQMRLNLYTSPLLAFAFVFIGEFVAYTFICISLLALIGPLLEILRGWSSFCNLLADLAAEL